ncbi:MAG: chromate transporter, partial [Actinomycetota bacterium]|nr:chromate transporter [Actinomycetota bacterium]
VIANLALYFALHTLFADTREETWGPISIELPELATLRPVSAVIAIVAGVLIFKLNWSVLRTLAACAFLGLLAAPLVHGS